MKINQFISIVYFLFLTPFVSCKDDADLHGGIQQPDEVSYKTRYYIDPEAGAYYNTGHSPSQAWESVARIMERTWQPGDTILIKRGSVYNGTLALKGNGTAAKPIVIGSYGDEALPLPEINGLGQKDETILFQNVQYRELHDLKITNKGESPRPKSAGIRINADNIEGGVMNHIYIKGCTIADVYGTKTHHLNGGGAGIHYYNVVEGSIPTSFNDIRVENCRIMNCQRDGLVGYLSTGNRSKRKANTNFVFRNNVFEGIPGDQIIVNGADGAIVEGNIVRNCAMGDFSPEGVSFRAEAAAAIWCIHSDNTVFRYNIVQDHKATWDGQAFDCDQNCQNTLFEYNISYNNAGGFFLLCPADAGFDQGFASHTNTIVRYNISINDGTRDYLKENGKALSSLIDVVGRVGSCYFYNNTFIKTKSAAQHADNTAVTFDSYTNLPNSLYFLNNIFYNTTTTANKFHKVTVGTLSPNQGVNFWNNCVYGYSSAVPGTGAYNSNNITLDPKFVKLVEDFAANQGQADKNAILEGLKLISGSPCLGTGIGAPDLGVFPVINDFWGNPIGTTKNIGAFNH